MGSPGKRRRKKAGNPAPAIVEVVKEAPEVPKAPKVSTPKPKIKPKKRKSFFDKG